MKQFIAKHAHVWFAVGIFAILLGANLFSGQGTASAYLGPPIVRGTCGTANNHVFAYTDTAYTLTYKQCGKGISTDPTFPAIGGWTTWVCSADVDSPDCKASRTSPPAPTITISASPTSVVGGSTSTLTWTSANTTGCTSSGAWVAGAQALSGSQVVGVPPTPGPYTYTLTCSGPGGSIVKSAVVTSLAPAPTLTITASPTSINTGNSSALSWTSLNATSCTASNAWSGAKAVSGSQSTGALTTGSYTYTLSCSGAGGTIVKSASVSVTVPPPPVFFDFSASPASVVPGGSSTLNWQVSYATSCTASGGWSGAKSSSTGSASTGALSSVGSTSYTLSCSGLGGTTAKTAAVTVIGGGALSGFAWAGQSIGWLSFNSASDGSTVPYGVSVDTTNRASGGAGLFDGYAWGSNIGWISFKPADLAGCPFGTCNAQINWSTGIVSGWARALANGGGMDGWIKLDPGSGGGVSMNLVSGAFSGYGWGSNVLGWVNFGPDNGFGGVLGPQSCSNGANNPPSCNVCTVPLTWDTGSSRCITPAVPVINSFTASPVSVVSPSSSTLTWNTTNATSCTGTGDWSGAKGFTNFVPYSESTGALVAGTYNYTLSCSSAGGTTSKSVTVVATSPAPTLSFWATPASVGLGATSKIQWTSANATGCTPSGGSSGWPSVGIALPNGSWTTGTLTEPQTYTYTLACSGPGGSITKTAQVKAAAICGNGKCEKGETLNSCRVDCKIKFRQF